MPSTKPSQSTAYSLQSVRNALQIVRMLQERHEMSVSDVAAELGVGMSTAHRLLSTLRLESFVRQSASTKRYVLGPVVTSASPERLLEDYVHAAAASMRRLADEVGETVHLVVRRGRVVQFVSAAESQRLVRLSSRVGMSLPAHATSSGKVLLAYLPTYELDQMFTAEQLDRPTPHTVASRADLIKELGRIKKQGFAVNREESEEDVHAAAAPILDSNQVPIAAVSVAGPKYRFNVSGMRTPLTRGMNTIELIQAAAVSIATEVG